MDAKLKKEKPLKIFIATPCYGGNLHYQYVVSLFSLTKTLDKLGIKYKVSFLGNESLVTRARNIMVGKFLSDPECGDACEICECDVSGDGVITPQDALCAFKKYLGICPTDCGPCEEICCDVNQDGQCTPNDALCIFQEYLGLGCEHCGIMSSL